MARKRAVIVAVSMAFFLAFGPANIVHVSWPSMLPTQAGVYIEKDGFSWTQLPAGKNLIWKDCLPGRQCARLIVPHNHSEPEGREATIALIRIPAAVSANSITYRGPLLFNPGGPGGSGVGFIGGPAGKLFNTIVGPQFDIVGFDPRGVGQSTPRASFFQTDVERTLFSPGLQVIDNSKEGVARAWARGKLLGQLAASRDDGYLRHINTDQTARDMLRIIEAHGRTKIQYWGMSYGTVLGVTFAAIFPMALQMPFYAPTASSMQQNLNALYNSLRSEPLPIYTNKTYGVLDYKYLRFRVLISLASPYYFFPLMGKALADLAAGNGRTLFELRNGPPYRCPSDEDEEQRRLIENTDEAWATIMCNDGAEIPGDLQSSRKYFDMMRKKFQWAEVWSAIRMNCVGWPKFPKNHFQGPFEANTGHAILFVGNTADPLTPSASAKKMSQGYKHAVVLTQNSTGGLIPWRQPPSQPNLATSATFPAPYNRP